MVSSSERYQPAPARRTLQLHGCRHVILFFCLEYLQKFFHFFLDGDNTPVASYNS